MTFWWQELRTNLARSFDDRSDQRWNHAIATMPVSDRAAEMFRAVEDEFLLTGADTPRWDDPHRNPDFEWGRVNGPDDQADVTDHAKFDIVHARARAWINVLRRWGGSARENPEVDWATDDPFLASADHAEVITSGIPDNPELVIGFNDYVPDDHGVDLVANVVIALGDPAVSLARVPDCGCDFCDYGSDVLLQQLDSLIFSIVDGSVEAQSGGQYSGYRTSFDAAGELSGDAAHKPAKHRARPWFADWSPRPMQDWA
ncbi:DUF6226 family protein [Brevibacterium sp. XM4083]|uniref:DUF6226 family protein n=1 Tax=Brevibacterium sp. XM4083 TaxID=2583238 RepID=UPI0011274F82|nr:DUF6226 family protein [Brevibacterium sp. XM4083]MCM1010937.1 DUF6226 family protein [Brevibacterium sp. XM4083]